MIVGNGSLPERQIATTAGLLPERQIATTAGLLPERQIATTAGLLTVKQPRVRDRRGLESIGCVTAAPTSRTRARETPQ